MPLNRFLPIVAVLLAASLVRVPLTAQVEQGFLGRLTPVPVDGTTRDTITGIGAVTGVLRGNRLTITGSFEGLREPATTAHLHRGLATGVRGSAFGDLTVSRASAGSISGSVDLTADQVESLRSGRLYVQIDSEIAPEGNLWGWLLKPEEQ